MSDSTANPSRGRATSVEFSIEGSTYPFVHLTADHQCVFELAELMPRGDDRYAEFFNVTSPAPGEVFDALDDREMVDATVLAEHEDGGLLELVVSDGCPAVTLARQGALPRTVQGADGEGRIVAEVPAQYDACAAIDAVVDEHEGVDLLSKHEQESVTALFSETEFPELVQSRLTDRQREVLEAAFEAGYYDWPRSCTGEDVAETLDITSATFSEHIHAAERKLLTLLFEASPSD